MKANVTVMEVYTVSTGTSSWWAWRIINEYGSELLSSRRYESELMAHNALRKEIMSRLNPSLNLKYGG